MPTLVDVTYLRLMHETWNAWLLVHLAGFALSMIIPMPRWPRAYLGASLVVAVVFVVYLLTWPAYRSMQLDILFLTNLHLLRIYVVTDYLLGVLAYTFGTAHFLWHQWRAHHHPPVASST